MNKKLLQLYDIEDDVVESLTIDNNDSYSEINIWIII